MSALINFHLKLPYKFHQDRIKIVGLHRLGANDPKMAFFGARGVPDWGNEKNIWR